MGKTYSKNDKTESESHKTCPVNNNKVKYLNIIAIFDVLVLIMLIRILSENDKIIIINNSKTML